MSVYRDTAANAVFEHPYPGPLTATLYREGVTEPLREVAGISPVGGKYTLPLTWQDTQFDGNLSIEWWNETDDFSRFQTIEVVTPLVSLARLRTLFDGESKTDAELAELESTVRVFIQAYTGQSFGYRVGSYEFIGTGSKTIALPQRLSKLTAFSGGWKANLSLSNDGFSIYVAPETLLTVKEAPPEEYLTYVTNGVIRVPEYYIKAFNKGALYTVTGTWGYDVVPDEVQEAAMLLANDFSCSETLYRDRYLESIKIQQDTITYHPGAFRGTGNARADLLLGKYRRNGMVII
jgi:hypothetical protein